LYASIGGGSPIRRLTEEQAAGVEKLLAARGKTAVARAAMNCSAPLVEDVVAELAGAGVRRFLALPLYPQYSLTTTKGAIERSREAVGRFAPGARFFEIGSWPTHPLFVEAHAQAIKDEIAQFRDPRPEAVHLLFSAHSIPKTLVTREGDPYPREVEASVRAIQERAGGKSPWTLAYQSKLGPIEWLGPATLDVIGELGRRGEKQVLAIAIAFVTDHVETLYEIDQLFGDAARKAGITAFRRTPGLNSNPTFLRALEDLILSKTEFWE
jgi:ferrochelatase